jgi:hypothetical protein
MVDQKEQAAINRAVKAIKWGGAALFLGINAYLLYRLTIAYGDGQERGEALHK